MKWSAIDDNSTSKGYPVFSSRVVQCNKQNDIFQSYDWNEMLNLWGMDTWPLAAEFIPLHAAIHYITPSHLKAIGLHFELDDI